MKAIFTKSTLSLIMVCSIILLSWKNSEELAPTAAPEPGLYKNLKILPKDISKEALDKVMDGFKEALGVKCNHCHARSKEDPKKMDFVSDEKEQKGWARSMMKMTAKINDKYFKTEKGKQVVPAITCMTCHNGAATPKPRGYAE
jgi:hypothetical protein